MFLRFLQYHNAVPIAFSILLLGGAGAFAATNPEAIYSETQRIVSVDNTYLVNKDLNAYSPRTQIVTVTEDADTYYVDYLLYTIDLEEGVWKDLVRNRTMKVSKAALGEYRDLGVYVTEQLKQNMEEEARRLSETQVIERKNVSQKIVATEYGGLIGKVLDTSMETLPGYTPVVVAPPPPPAPEQTVIAAAVVSTEATSNDQTGDQQELPQMDAPPPEGAQVSIAPGAPTIQVLGNNPARVPIGSSYADLGAAITGPTPQDQSLGIHIIVDGREMQTPEIDTTQEGTFVIRYEATNSAGTGVAQRVVEVFDPYAAEKAAAAAAAAALAASSSAATSASSSSTTGTSNESLTTSTTQSQTTEAQSSSASSTGPSEQ